MWMLSAPNAWIDYPMVKTRWIAHIWGRSSIRQEIYTLYPVQEFPNSGMMWDDHKSYTMFWPGRSSSMPFTTGSAQEQRGAHSQARAPCVRGGPFTGWLPNLGFVRLAAQKSWCGYGSIPIDTFLVGYSHPQIPAILGFTRGTGFWPIPMGRICRSSSARCWRRMKSFVWAPQRRRTDFSLTRYRKD